MYQINQTFDADAEQIYEDCGEKIITVDFTEIEINCTEKL